MRGKRQLKLLSRGETYEMNAPNLLIRFLPIPGVDWAGILEMLESDAQRMALKLSYAMEPSLFFGLRGSHRSVKGKIYETSTRRALFELNGHWDRYLTSN